MKPLFDIKQILNRDELYPFECELCSKTFEEYGKFVCLNTKYNKGKNKLKFCGRECADKAQVTKQDVNCLHCGKCFKKILSQCKKFPNHFCCSSCAAAYNNTHKTKGTRRSKLEKWLEEKLSEIYKNLEIHFNKKSAIDSEVDIYIPSLNIAIEINGIFHYKPIYGEEKFKQIQQNDLKKISSCKEKGIELISIDVSKLKHFKENDCIIYLEQIKCILASREVFETPA